MLGKSGAPPSRHRAQAALRHQGQELEGGTAGVVLAALPLAHRAGGHVQVAGVHRLTGVLAPPERPDCLRRHVLDRSQE